MSKVDFDNPNKVADKIRELNFGEDTRIAVQELKTEESVLTDRWLTVYTKFTIIKKENEDE